MNRARKRKKGLAKHTRHIAAQKRRAKVRRAKKKLKQEQEPLLDLVSWPDVDGLSDEDAARVIGEHLYWEDYAFRNPTSTFGAPM